MQENILSIRNLKKIYHDINGETVAIDDLNLDVKDKEILAIVGPSGCGKSTLLSILANLEKESDGSILFNGRKKIGYMLQNDSLMPWRTIFENSIIGLEISNSLTKENISKVHELLDKYGLSDFKDKYPSNLSGGMKQRVALIRTLATNPDILLLDEPYSALDYQTRLALSNDLYKIIKGEGKTVIMITHDIAESISLANRVVVLTKRPCQVKTIYDIKLENPGLPIDNRKDKMFSRYYDMIWRDLDVHI
ncbi:MAG: ABC transporter ATP-binding protein [Bacilli bacterium]|nr:ABC transporter ATP-binding protein [Bacilli bacterium]